MFVMRFCNFVRISSLLQCVSCVVTTYAGSGMGHLKELHIQDFLFMF